MRTVTRFEKSLFKNRIFKKKEIKNKEIEIGVPFRYTIKNLGQGKYVPVSLQKWVLVNEEEDGRLKIYQSPEGTDFKWTSDEYIILPEYWDIPNEDWEQANWQIKKEIDSENVALVMTKREGVLYGYLGESSKHNEDVGTLIWERLHISAFLGTSECVSTTLDGFNQAFTSFICVSFAEEISSSYTVLLALVWFGG